MTAGENAAAAALGAIPSATVMAATPEAVTETLRAAADRGQAVILWGGGTAQSYGYAPERADVLLDLSPMNRILAHEPGDLTVTVEAGVTLTQLQTALRAHRQFLPLDAPDPENATIGGLLATNAIGPCCLGYGTARDWLIGLHVVDAAGRTIRGGGKVVKNVTGYDLPKLHIGALGTLGVIVEATFKVAPLPEKTETLVFAISDGAALTDAFFARIRAEALPVGLRLITLRESAPQYTITLAGMAENVAAASARVRTIAGASAVGAYGGASGAVLTDAAVLPDDAPLVVRVAGLPGGSAARHDALVHLGSWQKVETWPGTGHTTLHFSGDDSAAAAILRQLHDWAISANRNYTVLRAPLRLRQDRNTPLWHPLPSALPLMHRLKESLDPQRLLNPGRFVSGI